MNTAGIIRCAALLLAPLIMAQLPAQAPTTAWTQFQYDATNEAVFAEPDWNVAWRADIGKRSNGGISVVGSTVYIDSFDRNVYAFDALTGRERWHRALPNVLMNTPLVVSGVVIVGTGSGRLLRNSPTYWVMGRPQGDAVYGLSATTGEMLWRFETVGEDMPTGVVVVAKNRPEYVFTGGDDHVYGLDPSTGRVLWAKPVPGVNGMAPLSEKDGIIYGISTLGDSGFLEAQARDTRAAAEWSHTWALDVNKSGKFLWSAPYGVADAGVTVGDGLVFTEGFRLAQPRGRAALDLARAIGWGEFFNAKALMNTTLTALDQKTGKLVWSYRSKPGPNRTLDSAAFTSDTLLDHGILYAPFAFACEVAAFQAKTGKMLWIVPTRFPVKTSPVLKDGFLFFGDSGAYLYVVRAADGSIVHEFSFPGPIAKHGFGKSPAVIVGRTLFISADRWLYALRLGDLERGVVSPQAAPPKLGPNHDWCTFDPACTTGNASGVVVIK